MIVSALPKLISRENLSRAEAETVMNQIMSGDATPAQIGAYLIALRMKGETVDEITGSARAMRAHSLKVILPGSNEDLLDIVGTGGDGSNSFNISTAAAFVIAATGRKVAKHGNRAASSKCGSADVLEAAGVTLELGPEQVAKCIEKVGIGFMFAPIFHPAMKHAIVPRRELKQRTIFNILGPLTNPAGATHQLTGVYDAELTEPIAHVLGELGCKSAMVIHSHDGLDELTTVGPNRISHLRKDGTVHTFELEAKDLGIENKQPESMTGGSIDKNLEMLRNILEGKSEGSQTDTVLLNAAAAMATEEGDIATKLVEARTALSSGAALIILNDLVRISQELASQK
jgi:anthranilate phosphoribosyltransferase